MSYICNKCSKPCSVEYISGGKGSDFVISYCCSVEASKPSYITPPKKYYRCIMCKQPCQKVDISIGLGSMEGSDCCGNEFNLESKSDNEKVIPKPEGAKCESCKESDDYFESFSGIKRPLYCEHFKHLET